MKNCLQGMMRWRHGRGIYIKSRSISIFAQFKLFSFCYLFVISISLFTPDLFACEAGQPNKKLNCDSDISTLLKAANAGDKRAQFKLGLAYEKSRGVAKNNKEAVKWYEKASNQNELDARHNLALMYEAGNGVKKDFKKAFELEKSAAELGHKYAQNTLGLFFLDGIGTDKNINEGIKWLTTSANQGFAEASDNLGKVYERGKYVAVDNKKAFYWYQKAAELGDPSAQFTTYTFYKKGIGVDKNINQAYVWCKKAALNGHIHAEVALGAFAYGYFPEVATDYKSAIYWWGRAARSGNADAQFLLGMAYDSGKYAVRNVSEAKKWYGLAAQQGQKEAIKRLSAFN